MTRLKLGTRGSPLARAQSAHFAARLQAAHPGLEIETVVITTTGDRFSLDPRSVDAGEAPNVKALFVKELEEALLSGAIDLAVHSAKDMPAELPEGLIVAAYPEREDPRDAIVGTPWEALKPGAVVATASLRRRIQLKAARPDLKFVVMRGNVDTRLGKLAAGQADALVLAEAGLKRLGSAAARSPLPLSLVVPAPGQGALAVETKEGSPAQKLVAALDDASVRRAVEIERRLMLRLGGGCSTPLGALAEAGSSLRLRVFWSDAEGGRMRRETLEVSLSAANAAVEALAAKILTDAG